MKHEIFVGDYIMTEIQFDFSASHDGAGRPDINCEVNRVESAEPHLYSLVKGFSLTSEEEQEACSEYVKHMLDASYDPQAHDEAEDYSARGQCVREHGVMAA